MLGTRAVANSDYLPRRCRRRRRRMLREPQCWFLGERGPQLNSMVGTKGLPTHGGAGCVPSVGDARRGLCRQGHAKLMRQELVFLVRPGMVRKTRCRPSGVGRCTPTIWMHGGEGLDDGSRAEVASSRAASFGVTDLRSAPVARAWRLKDELRRLLADRVAAESPDTLWRFRDWARRNERLLRAGRAILDDSGTHGVRFDRVEDASRRLRDVASQMERFSAERRTQLLSHEKGPTQRLDPTATALGRSASVD